MELQQTEVMVSGANQNVSPVSNSETLLINGGVTILAIFALSYFTKTLVDSIAKLLNVRIKKQ